MKLVALSCVLGLLVPESLALGYHEDVGIPEAARIKKAEAQSLVSRIISGTNAQWSDNPYLAGLLITLRTGQMSVCGGTLLSSTRVLTAGQCLYDGYNRYKKVQVVVDSLTLFSGSRNEVSSVAIHPGFNPLTPANDLAMLTLESALYINRAVLPAELPSNEYSNQYVGISARVSGYGKTSDWSLIGPDQRQQAANVTVIDSYKCRESLGPAIDSDVICTSGTSNWGDAAGPCGGDLGGPLVLNHNTTEISLLNILIGVISIQSPIGCENGFPTGYMRVTSYLGWIQSNL